MLTGFAGLAFSTNYLHNDISAIRFLPSERDMYYFLDAWLAKDLLSNEQGNNLTTASNHNVVAKVLVSIRLFCTFFAEI